MSEENNYQVGGILESQSKAQRKQEGETKEESRRGSIIGKEGFGDFYYKHIY